MAGCVAVTSSPASRQHTGQQAEKQMFPTGTVQTRENPNYVEFCYRRGRTFGFESVRSFCISACLPPENRGLAFHVTSASGNDNSCRGLPTLKSTNERKNKVNRQKNNKNKSLNSSSLKRND